MSSSIAPHPLFFETGSLIRPGAHEWAGELSDLLVSAHAHQRWVYDAYHLTRLFMWCWGLNSDPHVPATSISWTTWVTLGSVKLSDCHRRVRAM